MTLLQTTVDLTPLVNLALQFCVGVMALLIPPLSALLVTKLVQLAHLKMDDRARAIIENGLKNALAFGKSRAEDQLKSGAIDAVDVKSVVLANAVNYLTPKVPAAMKRLDMTEKGVAERIEAKLALDPPAATGKVEEPKQ